MSEPDDEVLGVVENDALEVFFQMLDKHNGLHGVRVVYFNGGLMRVLREGPPYCAAGLNAVVIRTGGRSLIPTKSEMAKARDWRFYKEVVNLGFSCGGAVVAWVVFWGSTGAAPISGGTSLIVAQLGLAAGFASGAQCLNAGMRVAVELTNAPEFNANLDDEFWYSGALLALDAVSLVGAGASAWATIRMVKRLQVVTRVPMREVLKGLGRQQRKSLTEELIRIHNPRISNRALKRMVRAGAWPKRYTNREITQGVRNQLLDAVGATVAFTGSAAGGIIGQMLPGQPSGPFLIGVVQAFRTF